MKIMYSDELPPNIQKNLDALMNKLTKMYGGPTVFVGAMLENSVGLVVALHKAGVEEKLLKMVEGHMKNMCQTLGQTLDVDTKNAFDVATELARISKHIGEEILGGPEVVGDPQQVKDAADIAQAALDKAKKA